MHVIVLGAGVIGVTTAYYLAARGCRVTVVDRAAEAGCGTSSANAAQLSYNFTESLAKPGFLKELPRILAGRDTGVKVRLMPSLLSWGIRLTRQSTMQRATANTQHLLHTALRSAELMQTLLQNVRMDFSHRRAGKLVLLFDDAHRRIAAATSALKRRHGADTRIVSRDEAIDIDPSLERLNEAFCAAEYAPSDEIGDAHRFAASLRKHLEASGAVEFRLKTHVDGLLLRNGQVCGAHCGEPLNADAVVVALGAWSDALLRTAKISLPIVPVRGYSMTLPLGPATPSVSLTSWKHRFVISRLDERVRIAGYTDFVGFDERRDEARIRSLLNTAQSLAPHAADYAASDRHAWGGYRPMTPNGRPWVGATRVPGLFVNTGHGMLGWTLACASGHDAADAVLESRTRRE